MHVKIQGGGGGKYANSGSSSNAAEYLEKGVDVSEGRHPFFNHRGAGIATAEVVSGLDSNRAKLCQEESKFFVLTISPSKEDIRAMGSSLEDQKRKFKEYINCEVMEAYATNFNKGLSREDIRYYAVVHEQRGSKEGEQLHAHILVSRKSDDNTKKLSPQTNHRGTSSGPVRGGFDRSAFYGQIERGFDLKFGYERGVADRFLYKNAVKKGDWEQVKESVRSQLDVESKKHGRHQKSAGQNLSRKQDRHPEQQRSQSKGRGLGL